jgi:hypothetical protein
MVKEKKNFYLTKRTANEGLFPLRHLKTILFICTGLIISQVAISQQEEQVLYGETKGQTLKYLRSMSSFDESDKDDRSLFIQKFGIDLNTSSDAKVINDCMLKSEPSARAHNSNLMIPRGTRVKVYENADNAAFYAVRFRNKWGFIPESAVTIVGK